MSNLPEPPPPLTEKLTVKRVLKSAGIGIFLLSNIIYSICIAVIFIYLGSTIPVLEPYAGYVAVYTLGGRTVFLVSAFLVGSYWCCLRLVAPKQAGRSISEWCSKSNAYWCETFSPRNGKLGRAGRTCYATMGVLHTYNGLHYCFLPRRVPDFGVYRPVMGVIVLIGAAQSIYIAYVGRVPIKKGTRDANITVGNSDSQPESNEATPAGAHTDDDTTTQ